MERNGLHKNLAEFQVRRLKHTYRDLLEDTRYRLLARFFFTECYGIGDQTERNLGIQKLYDAFRDKIGVDRMKHFDALIRLNELTDRLDARLVEELQRFGCNGGFTEEEYEEAYYLCDNYHDRIRQIDLIQDGCKAVHRLAQVRGLGIALAVLKPYAFLKGASRLHRFLTNGYQAFGSLEDISEFAGTLEQREKERLDRIYWFGKRVPSLGDLRARAHGLGIKDAERLEVRQLLRAMSQWE